MRHEDISEVAPAARAEIPGLVRPTRDGGANRLLGDVILGLGLADHHQVKEAIRARDALRR